MKHTSSELQKRFPEVYKDFFAQNDLVVSGHFSFSWHPTGIGHKSNNIHAKSKIPLKCYIGLKKNNSKTLNIKNIKIYSSKNDDFDDNEFSNINKKHKDYISYVDKLLETEIGSGFEVTILSEASRGHGLWFSWVMTALLLTGMYIMKGDIESDIFRDNYSEFFASELREHIFREAWKLSCISKHNNSVWTWALTTLYNDHGPIVVMGEHFDENISLEDIDHFNYQSYWLQKKFAEQVVVDELPFDYAVIFSWVLWDTHTIESQKQADINYFKKYEDFFLNAILHQEVDKYHLGEILTKTGIYEHLATSLFLLNIRNIFLLKEMLTYWYTEELIVKYIKHTNDMRALSKIIESSDNFADDLFTEFSNHRSSPTEIIGVMPIYSWKRGWNYLVILKDTYSRDTLDDTISDLKVRYPSASIQYASYRDWIINEWIQVEQYISWSKFSIYVSKDKVVYKDNKGNQYLEDYNTIFEKHQQGFLMDTISGKIYLNGQKLTSKEIKSQSTTVEVFDHILNSTKKEVYNRELSASTYASQQNQMLGKIVLPMLKLAEEHFSKKLPLICTWTLRDFVVRLD